MYYEKSEYERLISKSPVFMLDKNREYSRYKREVLKLLEYLYSYLMTINKTKYESYGVEIVEVATRCIRNFNPASGDFLHYFNAAWKTEYRHLTGKELIREEFHGIHFTEEQSRNYRKYMSLAQSMGRDIDSQEFDQKVAEAMCLTLGELSSLKQMVNSKPVRGTILNNEGEEYSFLDQFDSGTYTDSVIIEIEEALEYLKVIQSVFDTLQERQKPMMSKLITAKLTLYVREDSSLLKFFQSMSFFDDDVFKECLLRGSALEAKEISRIFGVAEASISRSWRTFKEKLYSADLQRRRDRK